MADRYPAGRRELAWSRDPTCEVCGFVVEAWPNAALTAAGRVAHPRCLSAPRQAHERLPSDFGLRG